MSQYSARLSLLSSSHMQDMQQQTMRLNSKVYGIIPVKLCRHQSLFNSEYSTAFKLHHMNTCKVCDMAKETVNDYICLYINRDKGKTNMVTKP